MAECTAQTGGAHARFRRPSSLFLQCIHFRKGKAPETRSPWEEEEEDVEKAKGATLHAQARKDAPRRRTSADRQTEREEQET